MVPLSILTTIGSYMTDSGMIPPIAYGFIWETMTGIVRRDKIPRLPIEVYAHVAEFCDHDRLAFLPTDRQSPTSIKIWSCRNSNGGKPFDLQFPSHYGILQCVPHPIRYRRARGRSSLYKGWFHEIKVTFRNP